MISIIICSRHKQLNPALIDNIRQTIGVEYELIHVDNSENKYSIFQAYNYGYSLSKYPYVSFLHEDVCFHTINWGNKIINHLNVPMTGIVGFAGGNLVLEVPSSWSAYKPNINITQADAKGKKQPQKFKYPTDYQGNKLPVVILDGVMLNMKRSLLEVIKFDESLNGFHGYDFDISLQSYSAGYQNYVMYDIDLYHYSHGKKDTQYFKNLIYVFKKHRSVLPIIVEDVRNDPSVVIEALQEKKLFELTRKMIKRNFAIDEIIQTTEMYTSVVNTGKAMKRLEYIRLRIFLTRLFQSPKYLFKL